MRGENAAFDVRDVYVDDVDVSTESLGIALPVEVLVVGDLKKLGGFVQTVEVRVRELIRALLVLVLVLIGVDTISLLLDPVAEENLLRVLVIVVGFGFLSSLDLVTASVDLLLRDAPDVDADTVTFILPVTPFSLFMLLAVFLGLILVVAVAVALASAVVLVLVPLALALLALDLARISARTRAASLAPAES